MKPLHKELQDIRIEKGISLEDISRETKIRVPFLEKIEEGDFTVVPEPFMRAFLREYAETLGLSPDRVISRFEGKITTVRDEDTGSDIPPQGKSQTSASELRSKPTVRKPDSRGRVTKEKEKPAPMEPDIPPVSEPVSSSDNADVAQAATSIISDSFESRTISDEAPSSDRKSIDQVSEEKEGKGLRTLFVIIFAVVIIAATLLILYFSGNLPF
jgi:cytoskeletal protein RodZ